MELITARIFDNPIDAHLLKSKLENEGVNCYLFDESTVTLDPMISNAVGGIKLKIEKSDTEKVKNLLQQIESSPYKKENDELLACPNCQSSNIVVGVKKLKGIAGFFSLFISLLMMIYPVSLNRVFICKDCDTEFKNS